MGFVGCRDVTSSIYLTHFMSFALYIILMCKGMMLWHASGWFLEARVRVLEDSVFTGENYSFCLGYLC